MHNDQANEMLDQLAGTITRYQLEHVILANDHSIPRKLRSALLLRENKLSQLQQLQIGLTLERYKLEAIEDLVEKTMAERMLTAKEIPQRRLIKDLEADLVIIDEYISDVPTAAQDINSCESAHWTNSVANTVIAALVDNIDAAVVNQIISMTDQEKASLTDKVAAGLNLIKV